MTNENNRQTLAVSYKFGERGGCSKNECDRKNWDGFHVAPANRRVIQVSQDCHNTPIRFFLWEPKVAPEAAAIQRGTCLLAPMPCQIGPRISQNLHTQ